MFPRRFALCVALALITPPVLALPAMAWAKGSSGHGGGHSGGRGHGHGNQSSSGSAVSAGHARDGRGVNSAARSPLSGGARGTSSCAARDERGNCVGRGAIAAPPRPEARRFDAGTPSVP